MLGHHYRRQFNIKATLHQRLVFAMQVPPTYVHVSRMSQTFIVIRMLVLSVGPPLSTLLH